MQELNEELTVDDTFVPIPGSPSNFILGPCFKTTFPPVLSLFYPIAKGEKLLLHSAVPDWFEGKTLGSWPVTYGSWRDWVDRVEKAKGEVWKSTDIYDAIQLSKYHIPKDQNLLYAALCYWSISTNSFHFRFGMMGPTVLDMVALTGLRPHGEQVSAILGMAEPTCDFGKCQDIYLKGISYQYHARTASNAVTEEEHISFLLIWLSEQFLCNSSITTITQCTKLAYALAAGRKLALAPFVLSNLYHGCTDIIKGKFNKTMGPFWILQFWLQSYFPEFQPLASDNSNAPTYGYPLAEGALRDKSFKEYFLFFHTCSSRTDAQFTPFSSRKFGPEWFKRSLDPNIQKLNGAKLQHIWASYLIPRDLPYSILLDKSSKHKYRVEHYSPNQFARQFGMTQAVPLHQSCNTISTRRVDFQSADHLEETKPRFFQLKRKFSFVSFDTNPSSTKFFDSWWSTYIKSQDQFGIDVFWKISLAARPLIPSDSLEVAAPRSNGLNGIFQSAGKFGQKTRRNYKGDSILSESLVEQEEPRLRRDSHESAENPLCKKMKPSALKMPLPGTICTRPCGPDYPTSTPGNEDRSKVGIQVSADDTPVSTSSSSLDKKTWIMSKEASVGGVSCDGQAKISEVDKFFARVTAQLQHAQSPEIDVNSSPAHKKARYSQVLAKTKAEIERLLTMPLHEVVLPVNFSILMVALPKYAALAHLSSEQVHALQELKRNLPSLFFDFHTAKKQLDEYNLKASKKVILIDELTKGQEHYRYLKHCLDEIDTSISELKSSLIEAKMKRRAIQEEELNMINTYSAKLAALEELVGEYIDLDRVVADSMMNQAEVTWDNYKQMIIGLGI